MDIVGSLRRAACMDRLFAKSNYIHIAMIDGSVPVRRLPLLEHRDFGQSRLSAPLGVPLSAMPCSAAAPGASNAVGGGKKAKTFKIAGATKRTQEGQKANALKVFFQREIDRAYRQLGCPGRDQFCYEKTLTQLKQSVWPKAVKYYGKRVPDASADDVKHRTEEEVCLWFGHRRFEHVKPLPKKRKSSSSSSSSSSSESWNSSDDALLT